MSDNYESESDPEDLNIRERNESRSFIQKRRKLRCPLFEMNRCKGQLQERSGYLLCSHCIKTSACFKDWQELLIKEFMLTGKDAIMEQMLDSYGEKLEKIEEGKIEKNLTKPKKKHVDMFDDSEEESDGDASDIDEMIVNEFSPSRKRSLSSEQQPNPEKRMQLDDDFEQKLEEIQDPLL